MSLFAADGSINITVLAAGSGNVPIYAADGSINVVKTDGTTGNVGAYDSSGAWNVAVSPTAVQIPARSPNGSLYVQTTPYTAGGQKVTVVSGSLGPGGSSTPTYYLMYSN